MIANQVYKYKAHEGIPTICKKTNFEWMSFKKAYLIQLIWCFQVWQKNTTENAGRKEKIHRQLGGAEHMLGTETPCF